MIFSENPLRTFPDPALRRLRANRRHFQTSTGPSRRDFLGGFRLHQPKFVGFSCGLQVAPGETALPPDVGVNVWLIVVPFISHSAIVPLSLRQRMSEEPSP